MGELTQYPVHSPDLLDQPGSYGKQRDDTPAETGYVGGLYHAVDKRLALNRGRDSTRCLSAVMMLRTARKQFRTKLKPRLIVGP